MPSTATITSYFTFTANTKARSTEVNNNFSVYRGHIIPVNTDTASASNLTHNLGDSTHRWNNAYMKSLFLGSTTTSWSISDATTTVGDLKFQVGGVDAFDLKRGHNSYTISGSSGLFSHSTSTAIDITNLNVTMTSFGQPIEVRLIADSPTGITASSIQLANINNGSGIATFYLLRNSSTIGVYEIRTATTATNSVTSLHLPVTSIYHFDNSATAGVNTYKLQVGSPGTIQVRAAKMLLKNL